MIYGNVKTMGIRKGGDGMLVLSIFSYIRVVLVCLVLGGN